MSRPPWPHMMPHDVPLFAAFVLSAEGITYEQWEFDVRLGQGEPAPTLGLPHERKFVEALTKIRADAVGWRDGKPTVFEVKPDARLSALGQIVAYRYYFAKETGVEPDAAIITDTCTGDCNELFASQNVRLWLVRPATSRQIELATALLAPKIRR